MLMCGDFVSALSKFECLPLIGCCFYTVQNGFFPHLLPHPFRPFLVAQPTTSSSELLISHTLWNSPSPAATQPPTFKSIPTSRHGSQPAFESKESDSASSSDLDEPSTPPPPPPPRPTWDWTHYASHDTEGNSVNDFISQCYITADAYFRDLVALPSRAGGQHRLTQEACENLLQRTFLGSIRHSEPVAEGGFGTVNRGRVAGIRGMVAIKTMLLTPQLDVLSVAREAGLMVEAHSILGEGGLALHRLAFTPGPLQGRAYAHVVMQLAEGGTVSDEVDVMCETVRVVQE